MAGLASCAGEGLPRVVFKLGAGDPGTPRLRPALVAGDEPHAVEAAADILKRGGAAADAATAAAFVLAVTLPSSAGLDARGACLIHDGASGTEAALAFTAAADDAADPVFIHAMSALHGRFGTLPWGTVVAPAATLARFGATVSQVLAERLKAGDSLLNDPAALAAFSSPRRQLVAAGDVLKQPQLADALDRVRARAPAGGAALWQPVHTVTVDGRRVSSFSAAGEDAGAGAAAGFAATSFVVGDSTGGVAACTLSMGRAFGRGVMGAGYLLAATDAVGGAAGGHPGLASVIVSGANNRAIAAAAASGGGAVARAGAAVAGKDAAGEGWVNLIACRGEDEALRCEARADARGLGYAVVRESGVQ